MPEQNLTPAEHDAKRREAKHRQRINRKAASAHSQDRDKTEKFDWAFKGKIDWHPFKNSEKVKRYGLIGKADLYAALHGDGIPVQLATNSIMLGGEVIIVRHDGFFKQIDDKLAATGIRKISCILQGPFGLNFVYKKDQETQEFKMMIY